MKHFLEFSKYTILVVTKVTTGLLIGLLTIFYPPTIAADLNEAPFSISGDLKITRISDGDSFRSGKLRIRLFGVDAPEKEQQCSTPDGQQWACGFVAQKALKKLVESVPKLSCDLKDIDRYGRLVMQCYAGKTDVGAALVRAGLALAYRQYSTFYSRDEDVAKIAGVGMWNGSFTEPWIWRSSK